MSLETWLVMNIFSPLCMVLLLFFGSLLIKQECIDPRLRRWKKVRCDTYKHNLKKYLRAFYERCEHEKKWGEDNEATRPQLQKLLRI